MPWVFWLQRTVMSSVSTWLSSLLWVYWGPPGVLAYLSDRLSYKAIFSQPWCSLASFPLNWAPYLLWWSFHCFKSSTYNLKMECNEFLYIEADWLSEFLSLSWSEWLASQTRDGLASSDAVGRNCIFLAAVTSVVKRAKWNGDCPFELALGNLHTEVLQTEHAALIFPQKGNKAT